MPGAGAFDNKQATLGIFSDQSYISIGDPYEDTYLRKMLTTRLGAPKRAAAYDAVGEMNGKFFSFMGGRVPPIMPPPMRSAASAYAKLAPARRAHRH
jgi:hypothetical protein